MKVLRIVILVAVWFFLVAGNSYATTVTIGDPQNWTLGWPFTVFLGGDGAVGNRYQQVYDIGSFPPTPIIITGIGFIPKQHPVSGDWPSWREGDYELSLSVTSKQVNELDTSNLNNNVGINQQIFADVSLDGPVGSTTYIFWGDPYTYDPNDGNLLLDIQISNIGVNGSGGFSASRWDEDGDGDPEVDDPQFSVAHNFGPSSMDPFLFDNRGLVTEFHYNLVPIPSVAWLLGSGIIGIVGIRRKFRK